MKNESYESYAIEIEDLWFTYQPVEHLALKGINLKIKFGEFVALIGQNGSGKTTLIKHMNGLLRASQGTVRIDGQLIEKQKVSDLSRSIGYVFQNPANQLFANTVEEEVAFGPTNLGYDEETVKKLTIEGMEALKLTPLRKQMPFMLGRGQMQRLAIASILSMKPKILIIDEPTTGLDWHESCNVLNIIRELNEAGHTIIMTIHNMSLVALYAKRVVVLREGEMILDGLVDDVFMQREILRTAYIKPPQHYDLMSYFPEIICNCHDIDDLAKTIVSFCGKKERINHS